MMHLVQPRKVLKDSYAKHGSALLIIKMGRAEQTIRAEIEREQVTSFRMIDRQGYFDGLLRKAGAARYGSLLEDEEELELE